MISTLQNEQLKISVSSLGAELTSLQNPQHELEYLWQGDAEYWKKRSPVLFPVVGQLKENKLKVDGNIYQMPLHGFAQNLEFILSEKRNDQLVYLLKSERETLKYYPYNFELSIEYLLEKNGLIITYKVKNTDHKTMYFSIGGHPGFSCPLYPNEKFDDYYLEFEKPETIVRHYIKDELFTGATENLLSNENILNLSYSLFERGAIIIKDMASSSVSLRSKKSSYRLHVDYTNFPYLGIWTRPNAPFICIEPWFGLTDKMDFDGEYKEREGIQLLLPGELFSCNYSIEIGY